MSPLNDLMWGQRKRFVVASWVCVKSQGQTREVAGLFRSLNQKTCEMSQDRVRLYFPPILAKNVLFLSHLHFLGGKPGFSKVELAEEQILLGNGSTFQGLSTCDKSVLLVEGLAAHRGPSPWMVMATISLSAQMSRGSLSGSWSGVHEVVDGLMGALVGTDGADGADDD